MCFRKLKIFVFFYPIPKSILLQFLTKTKEEKEPPYKRKEIQSFAGAKKREIHYLHPISVGARDDDMKRGPWPSFPHC